MALPQQYNAVREDGSSIFDDSETTPEELAAIVTNSSKPVVTTPSAADLLAQQILAQGTASKWTGEGWGSAEKNAADMAKILAGLDITDLNQFGEIKKTLPASETWQGDETGSYVTVPEQTITTYGNKLTGKEVPNTYSERQTGNAWGGTFAGSGNTGYRVQFDAQGNPYFYTTGASSNDLANLMQDLGPVGNIALAVATGGLSIPEQLAINAGLQLASGKDIGDIAKGTAASYLGAQIPGLDVVKDATSVLNGIDSTGILSLAAQNAAMSGLKAGLTGQDIGNAMLAGATAGGTSGAVNALLNNIEGFNDLTAAQKKMAVNAVSGIVSGKPLDQVVINAAISAANNAVKSAPSGTKSTTVGNFEDTEVSRLKGLGYDNKQIQAYFDRLDNITSALDNLDTTVAEPTDIVKTLDKAGLINTDEFLQSIGINNVDELKDSGLSNDDILRLINADIEGVTVTGNREQKDQEVLDRSLGKTTTDEGTMTITGQKTTDAGSVDVVDKKTDTELDTEKTLNCPEGYEPNADGTACIPVVVIQDKKCAPGFVYDEELQQCVPIEKDKQTLSCPEGYEPNEDGTACIPVVVVEDKKCAPGFVYDEELKQCVPIKTDEKVVTSVTTPVTSVVQTPVKKAISPTTGFSMPEAAAIAATFNMPQLANVFYYGKDFSSKKQKLDKEGDVVEEEYKPLSVTAAGAAGELVEEQKNKENNANDALDLVLGKSGEALSVDDLLNIVKGG